MMKGYKHTNKREYTPEGLEVARATALRNSTFVSGAINPAFNKDHPRRCKAFLKKHQRRCNQWACKGASYCKFHCPAIRKRQIMNAQVDNMRPRDVQRLRFYKNKLGPRLEAFVAECLGTPEQEQLNIFEELAIVRDIAGEAIGLRAAAEALPNSPANDAAKAMAAECVLNALKQVRDFARAAADIHNANKQMYSVHSLSDIVQQMKRIAYQCFEHDPAALDRFADSLATNLRLPKMGAEGTTLTPDQDVMEMDDSIPYVEDDATTDVEIEELGEQ